MSDNKSVIQAISNNRISVYENRYITEIKSKLHIIRTVKEKKVIIIWIPAHIGIPGNERADAIAKDGTKEHCCEDIKVPIKDLRRYYKQEMWNRTEETILQIARDKGIFYFENYYNRKDKDPWFKHFNEERYFITFINRLRTNHYNLNESLHRKNYIDSARCDCGNEREDIDHIIWQCNKYDEERIWMDEDLRSKGIVEKDSIFTWIKIKKWRALKTIYIFIKKIGRII